MHFNTLFFLLIISGLSIALAQVTYEDCCLMYTEKMSPRAQKHAVDYRWQIVDGGCNIPALIIIMRRGRVFCTDPKERWVIQLKKKIDKKKEQKRGKKTLSKYHPHGLYRD